MGGTCTGCRGASGAQQFPAAGGDHNRTYTVALACSAVDASQEAEATAWLRQELPRRRKGNLRPVGSSEGQLMARVTPIGAERDLSTGLIAAGLASNSCGVDG